MGGGEEPPQGLCAEVCPPPRAGIRSWDIDLASCNLDEQLKLFVSRHSATFSSIVKGKKKKFGGGGHTQRGVKPPPRPWQAPFVGSC